LGAIGLARVVTGSIIRLTEVAAKVREGDLNIQARAESSDEVGNLAETFNQMTGQLRASLESLEDRVAERTRALELSAVVSRQLSLILDPDQLVAEVVQQIQRAFNYYHVHIYLFDETHQNLIMVGGTGEVGKIMLEHGHRLAPGHGLVGRATETGTVVLVPDTSLDPDWLPNPLLSETKSEIAVPLMIGEQVLGALDVQQNIVNGLDRQDADLLFTIASQVAIALRNAGQFSEAQRQAERATRMEVIIQQIESTQTVEDALQVTIREVGRALDMARTKVILKPKAETDVSQGEPQRFVAGEKARK
jgi:nitrate/nitrite-specific signal transduction histidine kinase